MARLTNPNPRLLLAVAGPLVIAACVIALMMASHKPARAALQGVNGKIAFASYRAGNSEIYKMNPDGSRVLRLTADAGATPASDFDPAWSPDRTKIAFARRPYDDGSSNFRTDPQIFVMDADGGNKTQLTDNFGGAWSPTWSPDGSRIAYERSFYVGDNFEGIPIFKQQIYLMDADGSDEAPLRADPSIDEDTFSQWDPDWSPDGSKVAFHMDGPRGHSLWDARIYATNIDGTNLTGLTESERFANFSAAWSPDGSRIAFDRHPLSGGSSDIWVMDADGSGKKRLTTTLADEKRPTWSPDGTRIAYDRFREADFEIWRMRANGSHQTKITSNNVGDYSPDW